MDNIYSTILYNLCLGCAQPHQAMEPAFELQQDIFQDKIIKYRSEAFEKGILGYNAQQEYVVPKLLEEFAAARPI